MSVHIIAAFIRSLIQGRAPAGAAADAAVVTPVADALDAAVSTRAVDGEISLATECPRFQRQVGVKKHKRKRKAKMRIENGNPRKVPKLKSDTSASDSVCLPASAVQGNTRPINVDVPNYQGVDIDWNLNANGTVSAGAFGFDGHGSVRFSGSSDSQRDILNSDRCQGKLDALKKKYDAWRRLQSLSGFGWDAARGVVTAPDSVWAAEILRNPSNKQFRYKPLANIPELRETLEGVRASLEVGDARNSPTSSKTPTTPRGLKHPSDTK
ncbi:hypothetical protein FN846DRAFT_996991 [Sphaerosporella brunnea]|uniref:Myb/SANT-like domain-containing protein n=1 Tax=Sphaerosporella brunnea TaxID=1250544 RepID=A0A5J5F744_9PEZI|nr:hypothetical protein FN846DRAFT_996991 [Sphaerosporella brunnea]